jgi:hypothetical protein
MIKVTVILTEKAYDALVLASLQEGMSRTDVVNRAMQIYDALADAKPGTVITVHEADGSHWRTVLVGREPLISRLSRRWRWRP